MVESRVGQVSVESITQQTDVESRVGQVSVESITQVSNNKATIGQVSIELVTYGPTYELTAFTVPHPG